MTQSKAPALPWGILISAPAAGVTGMAVQEQKASISASSEARWPVEKRPSYLPPPVFAVATPHRNKQTLASHLAMIYVDSCLVKQVARKGSPSRRKLYLLLHDQLFCLNDLRPVLLLPLPKQLHQRS